MQVEARNVPSPAPCPGASRRIRIEEWTYDFTTGNCVKFRTVDKTISSSKLKRKFRKTWRKATSRFRNSVEDFGNKLRIGSKPTNATVVESVCGERESEITENHDSIIQETAIEGTESVSGGELEEDKNNEDQIKAQSPEDGKESEDDTWFSFSGNDLLIPAGGKAANKPVENKFDAPNFPGHSLEQNFENKKGTNTSDDTNVKQYTSLPFKKEIVQEEITKSASRQTSVTPNITAKTSQLSLSKVACEEACFDLSAIPYSWRTIERMLHKANIFSFKPHYSSEDDLNPEAVTVMATSESISRLREFLECCNIPIPGKSTDSSQSNCHGNIKKRSPAIEKHTEEARVPSKEEKSKNQTSLSLLDISLTEEDANDLQKQIPQTLSSCQEKEHENFWENVTVDEMLKITSAFNIIASKLADKKIMDKRAARAEKAASQSRGADSFPVAERIKDQDGHYTVPTNSAEDHDQTKVDSESDSLQFSRDVGTHDDDETVHDGMKAKSASEICSSLTLSDLVDTKFENLLLDSGVEVSVGDGFSNSIHAEDIFSSTSKKDLLNSAEKDFLNSTEKDFLNSTKNDLTTQIINLDNICPNIEPQKVYVCTCAASKDSSRSNDINLTNTDSSPARSIESVVEEPKNSVRKLEYFVSHCGPFPSKFEVKFDEDVDCEIARCLDQWRIHFGEKAPSQDSTLCIHTTTNPNTPEASTRYRRLFASSGRHFEFSFSEHETNNLRVSTNVQDHPQFKQKERKSSRKSATTI